MHNGAQCLKNDEALSLVTLINNSIASRGGGGGGGLPYDMDGDGRRKF